MGEVMVEVVEGCCDRQKEAQVWFQSGLNLWVIFIVKAGGKSSLIDIKKIIGGG